MKKIPWYKKLNPLWWLGNEDDGPCGDPNWFKKNCNSKCNLKCKIKWFFRNPFHNFMFYVIGVADKKCEKKPEHIWSPKGYGIYKDYTKCGKIKLPFISYKSKNGKFETYIGWRERGNFGISFRIHKEK